MVRFMFFLMIFLGSCLVRAEDYSAIEAKILQEYPQYRILEYKDLDQDTKEQYDLQKTKANPGLVCLRFEGAIRGCGVLLAKKNLERSGAKLFILGILNGKKITTEILEDYSDRFYDVTNVYLVLHPKSNIKDHESNKKVQMSTDGIMRMSEGKNAFVVFMKNKKTKKVWLSD